MELSEKIKTSFDSSDASVQDLMNQLTRANNTISQLNTRYKVASGITYQLNNPSLSANFIMVVIQLLKTIGLMLAILVLFLIFL